jgi:hypothetical protein
MTLSEIVRENAGRITCQDGHKFSLAADAFAMCRPVSNQGPWDMFEVVPHGMIKLDYQFRAFQRWCKYDGPRYGFIPEAVIWDVIRSHGGLVC